MLCLWNGKEYKSAKSIKKYNDKLVFPATGLEYLIFSTMDDETQAAQTTIANVLFIEGILRPY